MQRVKPVSKNFYDHQQDQIVSFVEQKSIEFYEKGAECVNIKISIPKREKSYEQIKAFHGTIIDQVQEYHQERNGVFKSKDRIKDELKNEFLVPKKQYWSDGSPMMIKVPHPERKGVYFEYHLEKVPSLADLTVEEMNDFITSIIDNFTHERNYPIIIEPKKEYSNIK